MKDPASKVVIVRREIRGEDELAVQFDFIRMECGVLAGDDERAEEHNDFHVDDFNRINVRGFRGEVQNHVKDAREVENGLDVELRDVPPETEISHENPLLVEDENREWPEDHVEADMVEEELEEGAVTPRHVVVAQLME